MVMPNTTDKVHKSPLGSPLNGGILHKSFLILKNKHSTMDMEGTKTQAHRDDEWKLEGDGQTGDPNLNVCESCQ